MVITQIVNSTYTISHGILGTFFYSIGLDITVCFKNNPSWWINSSFDDFKQTVQSNTEQKVATLCSSKSNYHLPANRQSHWCPFQGVHTTRTTSQVTHFHTFRYGTPLDRIQKLPPHSFLPRCRNKNEIPLYTTTAIFSRQIK